MGVHTGAHGHYRAVVFPVKELVSVQGVRHDCLPWLHPLLWQSLPVNGTTRNLYKQSSQPPLTYEEESGGVCVNNQVGEHDWSDTNAGVPTLRSSKNMGWSSWKKETAPPTKMTLHWRTQSSRATWSNEQEHVWPLVHNRVQIGVLLLTRPGPQSHIRPREKNGIQGVCTSQPPHSGEKRHVNQDVYIYINQVVLWCAQQANERDARHFS